MRLFYNNNEILEDHENYEAIRVELDYILDHINSNLNINNCFNDHYDKIINLVSNYNEYKIRINSINEIDFMPSFHHIEQNVGVQSILLPQSLIINLNEDNQILRINPE